MDIKLEFNRINIRYGYNHEIHVFECYLTTQYNKDLSSQFQLKIENCIKAMYPNDEKQGCGWYKILRLVKLNDSYPRQDENNFWVHAWQVDYYVPGCD